MQFLHDYYQQSHLAVAVTICPILIIIVFLFKKKLYLHKTLFAFSVDDNHSY